MNINRVDHLKALKASGWWISKRFEDPSRGLLISSQLLQDLQLVHPWLLLCSKYRGSANSY